MKHLHFRLLTLLAAGLTFLSAAAQSEKDIRRDFEQRFAPEQGIAAYKPDLKNLSAEQRTAMEFLYAYMAHPDMADYSVEYYLAQTDCALRARSEMPWGKKVPRREWFHFVLPPRVNNENLDTFRTACYDELRRRVEGMSMEEAVLEVNHWCHEYVTYRPSDGRTSSPLSSMRTATGRCGEESTFTVAALRAIGIPARQVYTPRWAHTDNNHAWVEAWVDGRWRFLGACEPEPVLDLGWFNQPASRGMLMHTRAFGKYDGPEDVMSCTPCFTEINVTENYAPVSRTVVKVVDENGKPMPGVRVEFKLYNYAELYTVMRTTADAKGCASIQAGLGDLVVWAAADSRRFAFKKFRVGTDKEIVLTVKPQPRMQSLELDIVPPTGRNNMPEVSPEAAALNARRCAREDSIRTAYVRTFADSALTARLCCDAGLDFARVRPLVVKSEGNHAALFDLLLRYPGDFTLEVLENLTDKDLRDFSLPVIAAHLTAADTTLRDKYIFSPRIANEWLTPWRGELQAAFSDAEKAVFRKDPSTLAAWIVKHVQTDEEWNPLRLCLSPVSALKWRRADLRSKGILFVAAARSMNIPSRIDEVTGNVQYRLDSEAWHTVSLEAKASDEVKRTVETSKVAIDYTPRQYMENPEYYTHFTLSRLNDGMPTLLNYGETDTWKDNFKDGTDMERGHYLLTSGTRMADGSALARLSFFPVLPGLRLGVPLTMREDTAGVQVIGNFNSELLWLDPVSGKQKSVLAHTGRGYFTIGLIRANHEPSNHILHDLSKQREALEAWGRPILLLFSSMEEWQRFENNRSEFRSLPSTLHFGVDASGEVRNALIGTTLAPSTELPVVIIGDTFNRVVFSTQGYTIGLGERITTTVGKI